MSQPRQLLTILCPVYEEEETVAGFYREITPVLAELPEAYDYNLVFVDNGSQDKTRECIRKLIEQNPKVFLIALSKNYGYQRSLECGLRSTHGDLFQIIDVDCEDPPAMILQFLEEHEKGHDIVYGLRADREEAWHIIQIRKVFYRLTRLLADENFVLDMAEFSLFTEEIRDAILNENNSFPFLRASIGRAGFSIKGIPYKRHRRIAGTTAYNFWGMTTFAVGGMLSSSTLLLRMPAYVFPFWALILVVLGVLAMTVNESWPLISLLTLGFVYCGMTLTTMAIYMARIYKNGLMRPNALINRRKSVLQPPAPSR